MIDAEILEDEAIYPARGTSARTSRSSPASVTPHETVVQAFADAKTPQPLIPAHLRQVPGTRGKSGQKATSSVDRSSRHSRRDR